MLPSASRTPSKDYGPHAGAFFFSLKLFSKKTHSPIDFCNNHCYCMGMATETYKEKQARLRVLRSKRAAEKANGGLRIKKMTDAELAAEYELLVGRKPATTERNT